MPPCPASGRPVSCTSMASASGEDLDVSLRRDNLSAASGGPDIAPLDFRLRVGDRVVLGRAPQKFKTASPFRGNIASPVVSKEHALFHVKRDVKGVSVIQSQNTYCLGPVRLTAYHKDPELCLEDNKSTNGTFINDKQLDRGQLKRLVDGDIIKFGCEIERDNTLHVAPTYRARVRNLRDHAAVGNSQSSAQHSQMEDHATSPFDGTTTVKQSIMQPNMDDRVESLMSKDMEHTWNSQSIHCLEDDFGDDYEYESDAFADDLSNFSQPTDENLSHPKSKNSSTPSERQYADNDSNGGFDDDYDDESRAEFLDGFIARGRDNCVLSDKLVKGENTYDTSELFLGSNDPSSELCFENDPFASQRSNPKDGDDVVCLSDRCEDVDQLGAKSRTGARGLEDDQTQGSPSSRSNKLAESDPGDVIDLTASPEHQGQLVEESAASRGNRLSTKNMSIEAILGPSEVIVSQQSPRKVTSTLKNDLKPTTTFHRTSESAGQSGQQTRGKRKLEEFLADAEEPVSAIPNAQMIDRPSNTQLQSQTPPIRQSPGILAKGFKRFKMATAILGTVVAAALIIPPEGFYD